MPLSNFAKIGISWSVLTVCGISGFIYSKKSVNVRRAEDMKIRQRMRESNLGEYDKSGTRFDKATK